MLPVIAIIAMSIILIAWMFQDELIKAIRSFKHSKRIVITKIPSKKGKKHEETVRIKKQTSTLAHKTSKLCKIHNKKIKLSLLGCLKCGCRCGRCDD